MLERVDCNRIAIPTDKLGSSPDKIDMTRTMAIKEMHENINTVLSSPSIFKYSATGPVNELMKLAVIIK